MKKLFIFCIGLILSLPAFAQTQKSSAFEEQFVSDIAQRVGQFKTPEQVLTTLKPRLQEKDIQFLQGLIDSKQWVELPTSVKSRGNNLDLEFASKVSFSIEIVNSLKGELKLNGHELNYSSYRSLEEQISYFRRVIKAKVSMKETKSKGAFLYSLIFPYSEASLTCNVLVNSGCVELSAAVTLWLAKTVTAESPLARCRDIYYYNSNNQSTMICAKQFKDNPTLTTIQAITEMLVASPGTSVEINCARGEGPSIFINNSEVLKLGKGAVASDYSIKTGDDPSGKLRRLPELAIKCCRQSGNDPLAGQCEEFVNSHLGSSEKRSKQFADPNIRSQGKPLPGVK